MIILGHISGGQGGLMSVWLGLQIGKPVQTNRSSLVSPSLHRVACTKSAPALKLHHLAAINNWTPWQFDPESSSAMHWRGRENVHEGFNFFFFASKAFISDCLHFQETASFDWDWFQPSLLRSSFFLKSFSSSTLTGHSGHNCCPFIYIWLNQP